MQPFDALTMKAVLQEAKPLLLNRRVFEIKQTGRDDFLLNMRGQSGPLQLLLSAHPSYGRICLIRAVTNVKSAGEKRRDDWRSIIGAILVRQLSGATLVGIEQVPHERVVDFVFSCVDEVGGTTLKVLTAEVMGRHSNIIFWQQADKTIIAAAHMVTHDMSRHREILLGAKYARPPLQDKENIFGTSFEQFNQSFEIFAESQNLSKFFQAGSLPSVESFLLSNYSGLGRYLAHELVSRAFENSSPAGELAPILQKLHGHIVDLDKKIFFHPALKRDCSRYSLLPLPEEESKENWKVFPAVNDLVDEYYKTMSEAEILKSTRERLKSAARSEIARWQSRMTETQAHLESQAEIERYKLFGDLVLANLAAVVEGQTELKCSNSYAQPTEEVSIPLSTNLSGVQNAQHFYRLYAKARNRARSARSIYEDTNQKLQAALLHAEKLEKAVSLDELHNLRSQSFGPKHTNTPTNTQKSSQTSSPGRQQKEKMKLAKFASSDGWTILVGRNRHENDYLLSRMSQPQDIWCHILGRSGAHVLVKVPSPKVEPPQSTLKDAAQIAARFSKTGSNAKVRIIYTHCRFVRKVANGKPGVVRYENEKTLEIDTSQIAPKVLDQLTAFQPRH